MKINVRGKHRYMFIKSLLNRVKVISVNISYEKNLQEPNYLTSIKHTSPTSMSKWKGRKRVGKHERNATCMCSSKTRIICTVGIPCKSAGASSFALLRLMLLIYTNMLFLYSSKAVQVLF